MTFDFTNFTVAAPLLALAAGALVVLLLDLLFPAKKAQAFWYVASLGAVATAGYYLVPLWGEVSRAFGGSFIADSFTNGFAVVLLIATFLAVLLSLSRHEEDKSGYLALLLWGAMGMIIMAGAGNLMVVFLGIELLSLALYVAVAFDPKHPNAREAAFKYFALGSVASAFILFGFALIYGVTGTMSLAAIAGVARDSGGDLFYKVGIALSLVGFSFKLALVPFHSWAPDVYQGAPTPVTAYMSVGTKAAAFAAVARFLVAAVPSDRQAAYLLPLSIFAAASMLLGSTVGIWQSDLKRLMAYSGIAHAGYLIMAIPGLGNEGMSAAIYYLAAYGFTAMGVFAIVTLLENDGIEGSKISNLKGLFHTPPALSVAMSVFMFALAGLPPTGGFIGKLLLATAAVGSGAWITLTALIVSTGISAYVYLKVIAVMFVKPEQAAAKRGVMAGAEEHEVTFSHDAIRNGIYVVLAIALIGTIAMGVVPGPIMEMLKATVSL